MSRSKKKKSRPKSAPPSQPAAPPETRAAETLTTIWMLATLNALVCNLGWIAVRAYLEFNASPTLSLLAGLLTLIAAALGAIALVLTPFVYRVRRSRPPHSVTIAVIAIFAVPFAAIFLI